MKKVVSLEFHIDQDIAPETFCQRVALACVDRGFVHPGDVVRSAADGFGVEVKPTPDMDWKAFEAKLDELFVKGCDTYMAGAMALFDEAAVGANRKILRTKTKLVFLRAFRVRGPAWVQSAFEYADQLVNILRERGELEAINKIAHARIDAEDKASAK